MSDDIRQRMFIEMEQKSTFDQARDAAYTYADRALERNVFTAFSQQSFSSREITVIMSAATLKRACT